MGRKHRTINQNQNQMNKDRVPTVFSVTTENFIGTISDAPPPIDIPLAIVTCWLQSASQCHISVIIIVKDYTRYSGTFGSVTNSHG